MDVTSDIQAFGTAIEVPPYLDNLTIGPLGPVRITSQTGNAVHAEALGTLDNRGFLLSEQAFAVSIDRGQEVSNGPSGIIIGKGGIHIGGGAASRVENRGYIGSTDRDIPIIEVGGHFGNTFHFSNDGLLNGEKALVSAVTTYFSNHGTIYGDVVLSGYFDRVVNDGIIVGKITFNAGDDHYDGRGGVARAVHGDGGADTLIGGNKHDVLSGGGGSDVIRGGRGKDILRGGAGDDTLVGCYGEDVLKGGAGADTCVFANLRAPDRVKDFTAGEDRIHLDDAALKALGNEGPLAEDAFHVGVGATDDGHRIIYHRKTGNLWYDENGDEKGGLTKLAKLAKGLDLSHEDFDII